MLVFRTEARANPKVSTENIRSRETYSVTERHMAKRFYEFYVSRWVEVEVKTFYDSNEIILMKKDWSF